jgi:hypothetical protein
VRTATKLDGEVGSHYQAVHSEATEDLVHSITKCTERELAIVLYLIVVTVYNSRIIQ